MRGMHWPKRAFERLVDEIYDRPREFTASYVERVLAQTPEAVNAALARWLYPAPYLRPRLPLPRPLIPCSIPSCR